MFGIIFLSKISSVAVGKEGLEVTGAIMAKFVLSMIIETLLTVAVSRKVLRLSV